MNHITVIGLGAGDLNQLPLGVYKKLTAATKLYVRTAEHPVLEELSAEGVTYESFDHIYEAHDRFEEVYADITEKLVQLAETEPVLYAVPGHPLVAEQTVQNLLSLEKEGKITLTIEGGQSFLDPLFTAAGFDPVDGFQLLDGTALESESVKPDQHVIIGQVYDSMTASDVKLELMNKYPDEHLVKVITAAGSAAEEIREVKLYELDHGMALSNLTSVYVPPLEKEEDFYGEFSKLKEIIKILRSPVGCPWDREQTHESLKRYLIEETYEFLEAVDRGDIDEMIDELGDVLLQVMLHAQIGEDDGYFDIRDVIQGVSAKMVRRHPHVFADAEAETAEDVTDAWQEIKNEEKGGAPSRLLEHAGSGLPALIHAYEIQKKAAKAGFDWDDHSDAWDKFEEEWQEFQEEVANGDKQASLREFGDVLFALVNVSRFHGIFPEEALMMANQKFISRFQFVEDRVNESGKPFQAFSLGELDEFWKQAKKHGL
ncbi:nucleoside triphosphate pyrophosphohydrolase [Jeotgalibacillus haloalkalitolerans]|uniref:Nucleoside triphosphate pyrophosphohydrolase n=1 Tax=Jeotgalibacillus haloalkalitolerans TaxID=3104292 RepID=A0ABU5KRD9_9BACL|nr:nucleoside triphosphate pyrophosphohydrolase [Jeotgalibacillus sp. HH7-29]MDZ5713797.1 nucleoside triphosphate pyrophosphohydrolase [Jeotgalibacillus sp. HH7-29]